MCDGIFTWLESSFYNPLKSYVFITQFVEKSERVSDCIGYFNYTHNLSNFTLYQPQANVLPTLKTTLKDLVIVGKFFL
jgi:hypothetical protein